jgi:hexosaminidase
LWTPKAVKDYGRFQRAMPAALGRLQVQDVNYRPLDGQDERQPAARPAG